MKRSSGLPQGHTVSDGGGENQVPGLPDPVPAHRVETLSSPGSLKKQNWDPKPQIK